MSDRFVRKVCRVTLDWTVEVQSLIDGERRRLEKTVRRLHRSDPALAERLRSAFADAVVADEHWPERAVRLFSIAHGTEGAELRNPAHADEVLRAVERGVGHVARLEPPPERASWHAAVVTAQREYEAAMRQFHEATTGSAVAAAAHRVEQARTAIDASLAAG